MMYFKIDKNDKSMKFMEELAKKASLDPEKIKQREMHRKNQKIYLRGLRLFKKYLIKNSYMENK